MNLSILIDRAQELADRKDTSWDARTIRWINEGLEQWALELPWPTLRKVEDFTFQGREATGRIMVMPERVHKVLTVADQTNLRALFPGAQPDKDYPTRHLQNTSGAAFFFRELGITPVTKQPTAAEALTVQTAQSDVYSIYVAGLAQDTNASGTPDEFYFAEEELSITGSGPVTSTSLFVRIDTIGKNKQAAAGDIVVSTATLGRIARLLKDKYRTEYRQIELTAAPVVGTVFQIEYIEKPRSMVSANQMPPPAVDINYLIYYAASRIEDAMGNLQEGELKRARADAILARRAEQEKNAGDTDYRALPEASYWSSETDYIWPEN